MEITVAIGLVVVVATALAVTTINGLKNSQFSQNQVQATKLAQEAVETVKIIRSRNCPVFYGSTSYVWYDSNGSQQLIWGNADDEINLVPKIDDPRLICELKDGVPEKLNNDQFSRSVKLSNENSSTAVKLIVEVAWSDYSGNHKSQLTTILADINQ